MRFAPALIAALLLSTSPALAKPSRAKQAAAAKEKADPRTPKDAKETFGCKLTEVEMVDVITGDERDLEIIVAVRLTCTNTGAKTVRIKAADVYLLNSDDDMFRPDRRADNLDRIFADLDPGPQHVNGYIDIAKGETKELGFTFSGGADLTDPHLTLDVDGTKYEYHRPPKAGVE